ncbi:BNR repeat-containing family member [Burkholderia sp. WP9]|uniref:BNR repeat-containing protein n=1 Tax=Burkholderia sp. WP9 TaxID=1500263 RepID=UPI00089D841F|nr:BNR repeat-containing protein [Burkholderia sp. WP9]SEF11810.1 BNR repeat-containing family member [Burkholderia sp. WP9]
MAPEVKIDRVWGGTRLGFDALDDKGFVYIAYYDADRWLSVVKVNKCTGAQEKKRVPTRFVGWDAHNVIVLALDDSNRLHVSGNMHVSPLVYARMDAQDQLEGLGSTRSMVGKDESQTTYPYFFRFPDGALGFSYRSGHSGDGIELINRLQGQKWVRWSDRPIFAPNSGKNTVNAYHSDFVRGPDGFFHVAWVWRENYFVETNFSVNYAKSKDLKKWENSEGDPVSLPITPSSAEVVDPVPERHGLLNNVRLGFDRAGRPVISYLKFDATGATQLFHARRENGGWKSVPATNWTYRWDPRGGGTIPGEISFSGVRVSNGRLIEQVHQREIGTKTLAYDDDSLKVREISSPDIWAPTISIKDRIPPNGAAINVRAVRDGNAVAHDVNRHYAISWFSLPADNRDKPRECESSEVSCNSVSDLVLHVLPNAPEH